MPRGQEHSPGPWPYYYLINFTPSFQYSSFPKAVLSIRVTIYWSAVTPTVVKSYKAFGTAAPQPPIPDLACPALTQPQVQSQPDTLVRERQRQLCRPAGWACFPWATRTFLPGQPSPNSLGAFTTPSQAVPGHRLGMQLLPAGSRAPGCAPGGCGPRAHGALGHRCVQTVSTSQGFRAGGLLHLHSSQGPWPPCNCHQGPGAGIFGWERRWIGWSQLTMRIINNVSRKKCRLGCNFSRESKLRKTAINEATSLGWEVAAPD